MKFGKILFSRWDHNSNDTPTRSLRHRPKCILNHVEYYPLSNTGVPPIDLRMLTKLAVLTDYFGCHEALVPYPSIWLEGLKDKVPSVFSDELKKKLDLYLFNYNYDAFTKVTRIAQCQETNDLYLLDLSIPEFVNNAI